MLGGIGMSISEQIRMLCARLNISKAELARRVGQSPQALNAKMKRESFTIDELEKTAEVLGVTFSRKFILPNGEEI
jgi:transcriptional regulator with XRE-family HTH domain